MNTIKTLFLILIPFALIKVDAQSIKRYEEGLLNPGDFLAEPIFGSNMSGQAYFRLEYFVDEVVRNDTSFIFINTNNYIDRESSWLIESRRISETLDYFQVLFDIREYYRRQFQLEVNNSTETRGYNRLMQSYYDKGTLEIQRFQTESDYGLDNQVVQKWSLSFYNKLNSTERFEIPKVRNKDWGFGVSLLYSTNFSYGDISNNINSSFAGFGFSLEALYKDYYLFINGYLNWGTIRDEFFYKENWENDLNVSTANMNLSLGYPILDNSTHKLIPYIGYGVNELGYPDGVEGVKDGLTLTDYGPHFGFWYDFNVFSDIELVPNPGLGGVKLSDQKYIRFGVNVARVNNDIYSGYSINLSLGYALMARSVETY